MLAEPSQGARPLDPQTSLSLPIPTVSIFRQGLRANRQSLLRVSTVSAGLSTFTRPRLLSVHHPNAAHGPSIRQVSILVLMEQPRQRSQSSPGPREAMEMSPFMETAEALHIQQSGLSKSPSPQP